MTRQRSVSTNWIVRSAPRPNPRLRLFCLPFAGGGASAYHQWPNSLPDDVEVCAVQLPGRENRLVEPPLNTIRDVLRPLDDVLPPYLDRPFAFFGHSMGALLSFLLARKIRHRFGREPEYLIVSACRAPQLRQVEHPICDLPEAELLGRLREYEGTPSEILDNPEIMDLLLPAIRADFAICEDYRHQADAPLGCPVHVFGGDRDQISREELASWKQNTLGDFSLRLFAGGHFYLANCSTELLTCIRELLVKKG